ncbi:hypothetical protein KAFR_0E02180 [Kazachstania africana CBS 2517]|uniref:ENTH domain-containing protein n=1 Tax=Kazachstania africana (strain ATCC 22294 / BCRC 22015 / CBS 2517 / CECT 1963 / NBRC 1671 / NRRL Y-8276) TaxID=1071382 RepID=H2AVH1_KAZAF|nr:hypothetical protein KAFR_0E02180 [Kazachstania africana CBS 2517]CCF58371.1 hypothetical protein KAFR_0E02180 [Kazachstania africana CBS 2517]
MTTYVKLVKGATKIKLAPPKQKYIDPILLGSASPRDFQEIVSALSSRLSDTAWTVVYKTIIVIHLLIREGEKDRTLEYFSEDLSVFQLRDNFQALKGGSSDVRALERYSNYIKIRCKEYGNIRVDYVREHHNSLKSIINNTQDIRAVERALDHVESLETQISALIKNKYSQFELNNELILYGFKLLVFDLLQLYSALNEGIITLLEAFFELTHGNAERTLDLYKKFVELTEYVVKYLKTGKSIGLKIPVIKHITTKLVRSLEEHLKEDENTHNTFNNSNNLENQEPIDTNAFAQRRLNEVREQKKKLEQQLHTQQQILMSPTASQQLYNPFAPQSTNAALVTSASQPQFNQAQPQNLLPSQLVTTNPFMNGVTQTHQQQQQPVMATFASNTTGFPGTMASEPSQHLQQVATLPTSMTQPHMLGTSITGSNLPVQLQFTQPAQMQHFPQPIQPSMTQPLPILPNEFSVKPASTIQTSNIGSFNTGKAGNAMPLEPLVTGSKNPFSLQNIDRERRQQEQVNPFSRTNYTEQDDHPLNHNPFAQQGLRTGTVLTSNSNVVSQPLYQSQTYNPFQQQQQQQQIQQQQIQQQQVQLQQQQFQQEQQQQQSYPNLIDI